MADKLDEIAEEVDEELEAHHELVYIGWIGRTLARTSKMLSASPKIIAGQRWMAYASEGTEPFRPVASVRFVQLGYALSFLYVFCDIGLKATHAWKTTRSTQHTAIVTGDTAVFHTFASMLLPAVTIHTVVKYAGKGLQKTNLLANFPKVRAWTPTVVGLCSIPFVVHPIDHGVEFVMDKTIRQFYDYRPHHEHTPHEHKE
jgi:fission process protein 1